LTSAIISDAFSKLENHDVVIGPTYDGGYYLLGMKLLHEPFFKIKLSTDTVFSDTINDFEKLAVTAYHLENYQILTKKKIYLNIGNKLRCIISLK
jgi:glycosyltransferase A (GT-A) superfamily protein (DUF2064 family)